MSADAAPTLICVTGAEATIAALERRLQVVADLHEVRLDCLDEIDERVFDFIRRHGPRLVVACRHAEELGRWRGSEEDRLAVLRRAYEAGPAYLDIELRVFEQGRADAVIPGASGPAWDAFTAAWTVTPETQGLDGFLGTGRATRVILSHHETAGGAETLEAVISRLARFPADVVKVAMPVRGASDLAALAAASEASGPQSLRKFPMRVVVGLGEAALASRARPALTGSAWTYVAASEALATAPGQLTFERANRLRARDSAFLQPVFLAGGPQVLRSPGPDVYNALFARLGLAFQYLPLPASRWDEVVKACSMAGAEWLSVTMPFKREALSSHGQVVVDRWTRAAGAANTVRLRAGEVVEASNTDAPAALDILGGSGSLHGETVLILGAGGSAVSVGVAAREAGARVVVAARDPAKARAAVTAAGADPADWSFVPWDQRHQTPRAVLVNCTPLGADAVSTPWDDCEPIAARLVVDLVVVRGVDTPLVRRARAAGRSVCTGLDFWCRQGALQMTLITGRSFGPAMLRDELTDLGWVPDTSGTGRQVIALVGMRGSGKTTVGRALAARLGWRFVDTDAEVERRMGRSIPDLFEGGGEAKFREAEARVVKEILATDRVVVATGGGCVENEEVRDALRSVFTVWLQAPAEVLAARVRGTSRPSLTGRPPDAEVGSVLARRQDLYRDCSSLTASTDACGPKECCDVIEHAWRELQDRHVR